MNTHTTATAADSPAHYRVEDLHVDVGRRRVTRGETVLPVTGISFDLLLTLVRAAPNLLSLDELMRHVWSGRVVSAETVSQRVKILRHALDDDADQPRYIAGVRGRGYHLLAAVELLAAPSQDERMALPGSAAPAAANSTAHHEVLPAATPSRRNWQLAAVTLLALLAIGFFSRSLWREPTAVIPLAPSGSVAVLPFANLTGDASKDYLGEGMADEVINTLTKVPGLKVPARTSSFVYKGGNTDIRQIAKDLGVSTILEGSVRSAGERIRITAQLINAEDGLHLWSQTYDEQFTDLFKLQDKLATAIVQAVQPNLSGAAFAAVTQAPPTQNVQAYELYLQGESLISRVSSLDRAAEYFQQALVLDPKFARAYAALATVNVGLFATRGSPESLAVAERAARQTLALEPNNAEAHSALAGISLSHGQWLEAGARFRTTLSLADNNGLLRVFVALHLVGSGYYRAGLEEGRKAYALAPANPVVVALFASLQSQLGRDAEAIRYAKLASELGMGNGPFFPRQIYAREALHARRYTEAANLLIESLYASGADKERAAEVIKLVYASLADPSKRASAVAAGARLYPRASGSAPTNSAAATGACMVSAYSYALLGAMDAAYSLANHCLDAMAQTATYPFELTDDLMSMDLRAFRQDPRFQALATRLGWIEYWQQYGPPDDCDLKDGKLTCH